MKTVGIIGGLGPETTSKFYLEVIFGCQKANSKSRPSILIQSVPIAYALEREEVMEGIVGNETLNLLFEAAKNLAKGGADFIVMPCNSLHVFIDELRKAVDVPVMNIIDVVSRFLADKKIKRIGILSASITRKEKLYETLSARGGIACEYPEDFEQEKLNEVILKIITGAYGVKEEETLAEILNNFRDKGVENILLACTDLQLAVPRTDLKIYDSMSILAQVTVREILVGRETYLNC